MSPSGHDIDQALEAILAGALVSLVLYGCFTIQSVVFFRFSGSHHGLKLLVSALWLCATVHTFFLALFLFICFPPLFRSEDHRVMLKEKSPLSVTLFFFSDTLLELAANLIYVYRIWMLGRQLILMCSPLLLLSLVTFATGTEFTLGHPITSLDGLRQFLGETKLATTVYGLRLVTDLLTTSIVCTLLWQQRQRVVSETRSLVKNLVKYSLCIGIVTAALVFGCFVAFLTSSNFLFFMIPVLSNAYSNGLLASLNGRLMLSNTNEWRSSVNAGAQPTQPHMLPTTTKSNTLGLEQTEVAHPAQTMSRLMERPDVRISLWAQRKQDALNNA